MAAPSTASNLDPEEAAALEHLDKVETALRAKPMPLVAQRLRKMLWRLRGIEALETMQREVMASGEPTPTPAEIDEWIREVRTQPQGER